MNRSVNRILVIDDEVKIRRFLRAGFELHGYCVEEAETGIEGLRIATLRGPDVLILDLALPDIDGSEVLERIRSWSSVPVIVLSVEGDESEKVRLLKLGADDYVVKPFGISELLARTEAALRRYFKSHRESHLVEAGPLSVDLVGRIVSLNGTQIQLTRKEYNLLQILAANAGLVVTHDQLLKAIWIGTNADHIQYLRILVRKLRQKIEQNPNSPNILLTVSGVGYRLQGQREKS